MEYFGSIELSTRSSVQSRHRINPRPHAEGAVSVLLSGWASPVGDPCFRAILSLFRTKFGVSVCQAPPSVYVENTYIFERGGCASRNHGSGATGHRGDTVHTVSSACTDALSPIPCVPRVNGDCLFRLISRCVMTLCRRHFRVMLKR